MAAAMATKRADDGKLLTPAEVASLMRVGTKTVYAWIENEGLEAMDVSTGGVPRWRISERALDKFKAERSTS
jgi:excisionase family DNA binding protein